MLKQPFQTQVTKRRLYRLHKLEHNFISPILFWVSDFLFLKIIFCLEKVPDWQTDSLRHWSQVFIYAISTKWKESIKISTRVTPGIRFILYRQHLRKNKPFPSVCSRKCMTFILKLKSHLSKIVYWKCQVYVSC